MKIRGHNYSIIIMIAVSGALPVLPYAYAIDELPKPTSAQIEESLALVPQKPCEQSLVTRSMLFIPTAIQKWRAERAAVRFEKRQKKKLRNYFRFFKENSVFSSYYRFVLYERSPSGHDPLFVVEDENVRLSILKKIHNQVSALKIGNLSEGLARVIQEDPSDEVREYAMKMTLDPPSLERARMRIKEKQKYAAFQNALIFPDLGFYGVLPVQERMHALGKNVGARAIYLNEKQKQELAEVAEKDEGEDVRKLAEYYLANPVQAFVNIWFMSTSIDVKLSWMDKFEREISRLHPLEKAVIQILANEHTDTSVKGRAQRILEFLAAGAYRT